VLVVPHPGPRARARSQAVAALWIISVVGLFGAWFGGGLAAWVDDSCYRRASSPGCWPVGHELFLHGGLVFTLLGAACAVVAIIRADRRWVAAAWSVWGGFCAVWWGLLLTS
jgi:hypothetical protein